MSARSRSRPIRARLGEEGDPPLVLEAERARRFGEVGATKAKELEDRHRERTPSFTRPRSPRETANPT